MAAANEKLMVQIQDSPAGQFDIESVEEAERVIEMVGLLGQRFIEVIVRQNS